MAIDNAWLQMGDFNVVRKPDARMEGFDSTASADFNSCLHAIEMDDMPSKGFWFTWSNKGVGAGITKVTAASYILGAATAASVISTASSTITATASVVPTAATTVVSAGGSSFHLQIYGLSHMLSI
ncbi:hypothetical protein RHGRI_013234 [Rhododendron griersonianum]|uniref:Uncharacterized protein n=1 Tax=Rhododendron griersonianum TaxID=479676 RepID=A0AAV6K4U5_9ERIC|nr:hypothetical protein RHGRI_013234 [Rhododendron griersonianum]